GPRSAPAPARRGGWRGGAEPRERLRPRRRPAARGFPASPVRASARLRPAPRPRRRPEARRRAVRGSQGRRSPVQRPAEPAARWPPGLPARGWRLRQGRPPSPGGLLPAGAGVAPGAQVIELALAALFVRSHFIGLV